MKCKYCNYENKVGDRYCENCGAMLENASGGNGRSLCSFKGTC
ncbi:zinc-ribbon domain-containing protein [Ruminococcus sp.]|nr:zinc-ribbon domain-containing protein [Ruminococcus sp.]HOA00184.1 zinc-ribbon domain-containing protein [Ruminococcus sp.]HOH87875.1 zinc-ribbon domain-containing protein [Ruminococcus sp.]